MNKQQGFGLPEVMISLLLTSLIITALMNHYLSTKQYYSHLQSSMDESMELQLVSDFMRDSIRQAGFTPCLSVDHLITLDQRDGHGNLSAIEIGAELKINRMSPWFDVMLDRSNSTQILLTRNNTIRDDRPILIADCYHAEVQRVLGVTNTANGQMVTLANPLVFTYQPPVYVGEWLQERFFIRQARGLFYQRDHADELTPLVKTMSLNLKTNLVQVNLGLDGDRELEFETRVRA